MNKTVAHRSLASLAVLGCAAGLLAVPHSASAGGFYVQEQSAKGAGRAFSGEAADTGAAALWWNPAAVARSGREVYVGGHGRFFDLEFTDEGSTLTRPIVPGGLTTPVGGRARIDDAGTEQFIPNAVLVIPVGDRFAVAGSLTRPYHLEYEFGDDAWTRYDTIRNKIEITDLQGTLAFRATDWLDLGIGLSAQYTDAGLEAAYPNLNPADPDARSNLAAGDGWNSGWTVGAQAHGLRGSLGVSYRSASDHDLDGTFTLTGLTAPLNGANFSAPADTHFRTPWMATLSGRLRATPQLTLNAQLQRLGWSEYDAVRVRIGPSTETILQNFHDTTTVAVGADYALRETVQLRAGLQYDPTPTPDDLREPGVADSNRWVYAAGATVQIRPGVFLDGAFNYARLTGAQVFEDAVFYGGSPAQTTVRMRGRIEGGVSTLSAGLRWKF